MKILLLCLCLSVFLAGCGKPAEFSDPVPDGIPADQTTAQEELALSDIPAETEEAPAVYSIIESIEELQNVMLAGRTITCPLYGWQKIREGELTESGTLPSNFAVRFILPEGWYPEEDTDEIRCMDADGRCRMTLVPYLRDVYATPDNPESNWHWDLPLDIGSGGYAHESWEEDGCQVNLHFYHYVKQGSPVSNDFGLIVKFYTYEDDPEDYYHTVIRSCYETITFLPEQLLTAEQSEPYFEKEVILINRYGDRVWHGEGYSFIQEEGGPDGYDTAITIDLPVSWDFEVTTASDIPRREAGIYSTKRMEYYNSLYRTSQKDRENFDGNTEYTELTTTAGEKYLYWETTGGTLDRLDAIWHHCEFAVSVGGEEYWFYICFLTFSDDPAGYFEDYIQPILDNMEIRTPDSMLRRPVYEGQSVTYPLYGWRIPENGEILAEGTLPYNFSVCFTLPEKWQMPDSMNDTNAVDEKGRLRMEMSPYLQTVPYGTALAEDKAGYMTWDDNTAAGLLVCRETWTEEDSTPYVCNFALWDDTVLESYYYYYCTIRCYSYPDDPADYRETVIEPFLDSVSFTPDGIAAVANPVREGNRHTYTMRSYGNIVTEDGEARYDVHYFAETGDRCTLTLTLPEEWRDGDDLLRLAAGETDAGRLSVGTDLTDQPFTAENYLLDHMTLLTDDTEGVTSGGQPYTMWSARRPNGEEEVTLWNYALPVEWQGETYYTYLQFFEYDTDPASYYETCIRPAADSVEIVFSEGAEK
ncbi:MAG: hypothetical protein IJ480_01125 [Clostridia bacterium]|nr:hypothetical protein [Clostridia bacterium]